MITISLAQALICFAGQCYPALVGPGTPVGQFTLAHHKVLAQGYGGDVLVFKEDERSVYAIHRVYTLNPKQRRLERLRSPSVRDRTQITDGCVNVAPEVYEALVACCAKQPVEIKTF